MDSKRLEKEKLIALHRFSDETEKSNKCLNTINFESNLNRYKI